MTTEIYQFLRLNFFVFFFGKKFIHLNTYFPGNLILTAQVMRNTKSRANWFLHLGRRSRQHIESLLYGKINFNSTELALRMRCVPE